MFGTVFLQILCRTRPGVLAEGSPGGLEVAGRVTGDPRGGLAIEVAAHQSRGNLRRELSGW